LFGGNGKKKNASREGGTREGRGGGVVWVGKGQMGGRGGGKEVATGTLNGRAKTPRWDGRGSRW